MAARRLTLTSLALSACNMAAAQVLDGLSEKDFLSDMPIVLSVSRLPQRLDETPGAVTILDRAMIRRTGARDVADLLRLVPGFQSSASYEGVAPLASYHGGFDAYSNRIQLLIDGRSAYSPYFIGTVAPGLQSVALQDIERIEVLRGSNSAAYGARAVLGVINIVTRHTGDTLGTQVSVTGGENSIRDAQARLGWGQDNATYRLTVDRRASDGLTGEYGRNKLDHFSFRSDLSPDAGTQVQLRAGGMRVASGRGIAGAIGNPQRDSYFGSAFLQLDWSRSLGEDEDLAFTASRTQEYYKDSFPYFLHKLPVKNAALLFGPNDIYTVGVGGQASNDTVSLQHTFRATPSLRMVWGGELRRERVVSLPLYDSAAAFVTDFTRMFGNAEWQMAPELVLNAGAMVEDSSDSGQSFSPRVMLNWHAADGQTLRAGVTRGYRPPSTFEKHTNLRYVLKPTLLKVPPLVYTVSRPNTAIQPEAVLTREFGYLGDFPGLKLGLDVRAFTEQMNGFITQLTDAKGVKFYVNDESFLIKGLEYQLKWRPWQGADLSFNQAFIDIGSTRKGIGESAPTHASTLVFSQNLPGGVDLTLLHQKSSEATFQAGNEVNTRGIKRTDVRVAMPLRVGPNHGEFALVVQNMGAPYPDFRQQFSFQRRAFVTLNFEN
jgi:iron complex outermembrane receptor protein